MSHLYWLSEKAHNILKTRARSHHLTLSAYINTLATKTFIDNRPPIYKPLHLPPTMRWRRHSALHPYSLSLKPQTILHLANVAIQYDIIYKNSSPHALVTQVLEAFALDLLRTENQ